jgi:proliferating cell nuclear antigen PCNA
LKKVLSTREKSQTIQIKLNSDDADKLQLNLVSPDKAVFDKDFEIPLLDLEQEVLAIPDTEPQAEFRLSSLHFSSIINQLKLFGQNMDIECSEENIFLNSISSDEGKMRVSIDNSELSEFTIDEGANLKLSFSLTYLHNICAYNKLSKDVLIRLTEEFPLQVIYFLGGEEDATMRFFLAPKINDE